MTDFTVGERIKAIFNMVSSSTFFIAIFIVLILAAIVFMASNKIKNKIPKYLIMAAYALVVILVLVKYGTYIGKLNDDFMNKIFSIMYFPNIISYICMLLISILIMIRTFVKPNYDKTLKIGNIFCFSGMEFLFVLILEYVKKSDVDIYSISSVYANEQLLILLQASASVFFIWIGILIFYYVVEKLANKVEGQNDISVRTTAKPFKMNYKKIKNEEIKDFNDDDFNIAYNNFQNNQNKAKYSEIFGSEDKNEFL